MFVEKFFQFAKHNTNLKREIIGELATFIAMFYVI